MSRIDSPDRELAMTAASRYADLRDRRANPAGTFDRAGRFSLDNAERSECCAAIRTPSRAYPYSEMQHARTLRHVCSVAGVDPRAVRAIVRELDA